MNRIIQTERAAAPASGYAQAVETAAGARLLHVSGQVGIGPDGVLGDDLTEQIERAWQNVFAILDEAGMAKDDIVDVLVLLTARDAVPVFRDIRDRVLGGHHACSTMMICDLAHPDWLVEIAVRAARAE